MIRYRNANAQWLNGYHAASLCDLRLVAVAQAVRKSPTALRAADGPLSFDIGGHGGGDDGLSGVGFRVGGAEDRKDENGYVEREIEVVKAEGEDRGCCGSIGMWGRWC